MRCKFLELDMSVVFAVEHKKEKKITNKINSVKKTRMFYAFVWHRSKFHSQQLQSSEYLWRFRALWLTKDAFVQTIEFKFWQCTKAKWILIINHCWGIHFLYLLLLSFFPWSIYWYNKIKTSNVWYQGSIIFNTWLVFFASNSRVRIVWKTLIIIQNSKRKRYISVHG